MQGCIDRAVWATKADFANLWMDEDTFLLDAACQAKKIADDAMSMSVFPVSETNDLQNTQKVPAVSKRGLKRRREKLPSEPGNTWWQHLGKKTQGDALQEFYVAGKKKGLNMTAKCFASRLYKHPSLVDVDMRRNAHRDAVEFVETMSKRANNA